MPGRLVNVVAEREEHRCACWRSWVLGLLTAACGFQLRGQATLPFETLYIAIPDISPLGTELKRNVIAGTHTKLVDDPAQAQATLALVSEARDKSILSSDTSGRVREFQLRLPPEAASDD